MSFKKLLGSSLQAGFSLIEVLIVFGILVVLLAISTQAVPYAIDKGNIGESIAYAKLISEAADLYYTDIGFYPPDVDRGCDPGFLEMFPHEVEPTTYDCSGEVFIPDYHPTGWEDEVEEYWLGPYLREWNTSTPWGGKYDYNYWPDGQLRYGVCLSPGIYIGIQRDYSDQNGIPEHTEERMINDGLDRDEQINGEAQLLVLELPASANPEC